MIDIVIPIHSIDNILFKTISSVGLQKNIKDIRILLIGNYDIKDIEFILNKYKDIVNIQYVKINNNIIDYNLYNNYVFFLRDNDYIYNSLSIIDMIDNIGDNDVCIGKVVNYKLDENYMLDINNTMGKLYTREYINKCKVEYDKSNNIISNISNIESKYILLDSNVYMDLFTQ